MKEAGQKFLEKRDRTRLEQAIEEDIRWGLHGK